MELLERYRKNRTVRMITCVLFCLYLFAVLTYSLLYYGWTRWSNGAVYPFFSDVQIRTILQVMAWLLIALEFPYSWKRGLLALAAVLARQYVPAIGGGNARMLELIILAILSNLGSRKANAWTWLGVHAFYIPVLILLNTRGLVVDFLKPEKWLGIFGGDYGHSLGMGHPNSLALFAMSTALMILYLIPRKKLRISVLLSAAVAFFCLWFTKSKTIILLLLIAPFVIWLTGRCRLESRKTRIIFTLLPLLACAVSFGLSWYYMLHEDQIAHSTFWMRFQELKYLIEYFHFPLGAPSKLDYRVYFDNFYIYLFACCGYAAMVPVLFSFCGMHRTLAKEREHELLGISVIFILYSMMENCIFYPAFFFVPVLAFTGSPGFGNQEPAHPTGSIIIRFFGRDS